MNYELIYFSLIMNAKRRGTFTGYGERHHIIPKSLGGSNLKKNIIKLTAREHYIAHKILVKLTKGEF